MVHSRRTTFPIGSKKFQSDNILTTEIVKKEGIKISKYVK